MRSRFQKIVPNAQWMLLPASAAEPALRLVLMDPRCYLQPQKYLISRFYLRANRKETGVCSKWWLPWTKPGSEAVRTTKNAKRFAPKKSRSTLLLASTVNIWLQASKKRKN